MIASLRDIFDRAVCLTPGGRPAFLGDACGDDAGLRGEIERLLSAHDRLGSVFDTEAGSLAADRAARPALAPGARLGPYSILDALGAGGMGEVYKARDTRLDRDVAVKILPAAFAADPDRITRFQQEARATAALNHANIVAVYDVGDVDGLSYIVTELLAGETLRDRLRSGPLPVRKAVEIGLRTLAGLAAAHDRGITHRDLKPENIFLTTNDDVKILDFGLAKILPDELRPSEGGARAVPPETTPGAILGTIGYMAPEQVRGLPSDGRADIFSFGAILYEMLSGSRAFDGPTPADTLSAILTADPPDLTRSGEPVSRPVGILVQRCLEKDPRHRFQSARDLGFALETVASSSSGGEAARANSPRGRRRPRVAAGAVAALLAIGVAVAGWLLLRPEGTSRRRLAVDITIPSGLAIDGPPALAPDRHALAFVALDDHGVSRIWIRTFDGLEPKALEGTEGASQPFWSPDSRALGFFARGKLWHIAMFAGAPKDLAEASSPRGGAWSKDDVIVFAPHADQGLYRVASGGGPVTPLTTLDGKAQELSHRWPRVLPDGRHVLFMIRMSGGEPLRHVLSIASIEGGAARRLVDADSTGVYADGRLLFQRGATVFAQPFDATDGVLSGEPAAVAEDVWSNVVSTAGLVGFDAVAGAVAWRPALEGQSQLTWMDRSGRPIEVVGPAGSESLALSPDGRVLVVGRRDEQLAPATLWRLDLARRTLDRLMAAYSTATSPVWSPDGRRIAYTPIRTGTFDVWIKSLEPGGGERPLVQSTRVKAPASWSPDGGSILFNELDPKHRLDLWSVESATSGSTPELVAGGPFDQCCGRFSPDGKWIAYVSNETGRAEVLLRPFGRRGTAVQVSEGGGALPEWRRDGRELYYVAPDNRLMAVAVTVNADAVTALAPVTLFRINIPTFPGVVLSATDDRVYAPAATGDRFIVNQFTGDARTRYVSLVFDWTKPGVR